MTSQPHSTQTLPLIILFGPPGSGKGTQANLICQELDILNLSIGNSVRAFINQYDFATSPELSRVCRLKEKMVSGELQDFDDIKYIIETEIKNDILSGRNVLIEGLPRTAEQAAWLADFFSESKVDCLFFHFQLPESLIIERLSHRYYAPGVDVPYPSYEEALKHCKASQTPIRRQDDQDINVIKHRLDVQYNSCKESIIQTISKCATVRVVDIDASPSTDTIFESLLAEIQNHMQAKVQVHQMSH